MSRAHITVVAQIKGGSGKSTLASNLMVSLAHAGLNVVGLDADPQQSLKSWFDRRNEHAADLPVVQCVSSSGDSSVLARNLAANADAVVIDTPGWHDSRELTTALRVADTVLIPLRASRPDLDVLLRMHDKISAAKDARPHLRAIVVLSMVPTNPFLKESEPVVDLFKTKKLPELELAPFVIKERKVYRDAMMAGRGAFEFNNPQAALEMIALTNLYKETN